MFAVATTPVARMYGPDFLVFYACVILAVLAITWWAVRRLSQPLLP